MRHLIKILFVVLLLLFISVEKSNAQFGGTFKTIWMVNGDSALYSESDGSIYYNESSDRFRFREDGVWRGLGIESATSIDSARIYDSLAVHRTDIDLRLTESQADNLYWSLNNNFTVGPNITTTFNFPNDFDFYEMKYEWDGSNTTSSMSFSRSSSGTGSISLGNFDTNTFGYTGINITSANDIVVHDGLGVGRGLEGADDFSLAVGEGSNTYTQASYTDKHIVGENVSSVLQNPGASEDGKTIAWDNTANRWDTVSISGGGSNFWPLSGDFSTSTAQTISLAGDITFSHPIAGLNTFLIDNGANFIARSDDGAEIDMGLNTLGTDAVRLKAEDGSSLRVGDENLGGAIIIRGPGVSTPDSTQITFSVAGSANDAMFSYNRLTEDYSMGFNGGSGSMELAQVNVDDPATNYHAANKQYVDNASSSQASASLTDGNPTNAELNSAFPSASAGFRATIKDTDGTALMYLVTYDGSGWWNEPLQASP